LLVVLSHKLIRDLGAILSVLELTLILLSLCFKLSIFIFNFVEGLPVVTDNYAILAVKQDVDRLRKIQEKYSKNSVELDISERLLLIIILEMKDTPLLKHLMFRSLNILNYNLEKVITGEKSLWKFQDAVVILALFE